MADNIPIGPPTRYEMLTGAREMARKQYARACQACNADAAKAALDWCEALDRDTEEHEAVLLGMWALERSQKGTSNAR